MSKYTTNQIVKTLEKLFQSNINTEKQIRAIQWDSLDEINKEFTPIEKSLIMDFRNAVVKKKIIEFLSGKNLDERNKEKHD